MNFKLDSFETEALKFYSNLIVSPWLYRNKNALCNWILYSNSRSPLILPSTNDFWSLIHHTVVRRKVQVQINKSTRINLIGQMKFVWMEFYCTCIGDRIHLNYHSCDISKHSANNKLYTRFVWTRSHVDGHSQWNWTVCRGQRRSKKKTNKVTGATTNPLYETGGISTTLLPRLTLVGGKIRLWFNAK